jgi:hypothetical protein
MSHSKSKHHRHRGKQRRWRPVRWATLLTGILALPVGGLLLAWAARDGNPVPYQFGVIYLSIGAVSLLIYGLITTYARLRARNKSTPPQPAPDLSSSRAGLALLMALILMAFLSGIVIHALTATHMKLRAGEASRTRLLLRAATLDAAWGRLQALTGTTPATIPDQTLENRLPSGIATRITIHPLDRTALPAPLQRIQPPLFGQYFSVVAEAVLGRSVGTAQGMACRLPSGEIRVLSWWERP